MNRKLEMGVLIFFILVGFSVNSFGEKTTYTGPIYLQEGEVVDVNIVISPAEKIVLQRLSDLELIIAKMEVDVIKIVRISDGYITAQALFQSEKILVNGGLRAGYTDTLKKIDEMEKIADIAYEAKDEIAALQEHLEQVKAEIDVEPVETILKNAQKEMIEERFENASKFAQEGEDKIVELQSLDTKAKAAAEAATANIISFLDINKYTIAALFLAGIIIFLIIRNRLNHYLTGAKMRHLELERETLRNELKNTQDEYFIKKNIPESIYNIRIKVYSTMIREATRKIAVLSEMKRRTELKLGKNSGEKDLANIPPIKNTKKDVKKNEKKIGL